MACRSLILIKNVYFIYFLPNSKLIYGCSDTTNYNTHTHTHTRTHKKMTRFTNSKLDKSDALNAERSHSRPNHWITIRHHTLQWRNNERDGVSNHRRLDCLLNRLFRCRSKKTSKLTGLCEGNSPATGEFPAVTDEFSAQKPVTRNMFPFDDVIMKTGNIDVGDECSSMKCEVSAPP